MRLMCRVDSGYRFVSFDIGHHQDGSLETARRFINGSCAASRKAARTTDDPTRIVRVGSPSAGGSRCPGSAWKGP